MSESSDEQVGNVQWEKPGDKRLREVLAKFMAELKVKAGSNPISENSRVLAKLQELQATDDLNGNSAIHSMRKIVDIGSSLERELLSKLGEQNIDTAGNIVDVNKESDDSLKWQKKD